MQTISTIIPMHIAKPTIELITTAIITPVDSLFANSSMLSEDIIRRLAFGVRMKKNKIAARNMNIYIY